MQIYYFYFVNRDFGCEITGVRAFLCNFAPSSTKYPTLLSNKFLFTTLMPLLFLTRSAAQDSKPFDLAEGLTYGVEMQASVSKGETPLWLNANRHGLSSLENVNGYVMAGISRPLSTDSTRRWGVGYGVEMAVPFHYTSNLVVQQAYAEVRWLCGTLTAGAKEYPMELKSNSLSSGSQTLGINARPVPQVRFALPDYWAVPFTRGWLKLKGHIAYGRLTDDKWQRSFTGKQNPYSDDVLYHSKAGYLRIGGDGRSSHFSAEIGLEMAALFGGTSYEPNSDGTVTITKGGTGLGDYWRAFIPGGAERVEEGTPYQNAEGDQLGSWVMRLNWDEDKWRMSLYADHFFEDHSGMFLLDYDGYGEGDEWDTRKKHRYMLYSLKDIMLGAEFSFKEARPVQAIVLEYLYTKYQSGAIYHDHTPSFPDHIGGQDSYYNHYVYQGWQHWGQVMGNPLYRSPIYNSDGTISVKNNRFMAFHVGVEGRPAKELYYRVLGSWQDGLGSYSDPYTHKRHNVSLMTEATYSFSQKELRGWSLTGAFGMDFGSILGRNTGFQLTIRKTGRL